MLKQLAQLRPQHLRFVPLLRHRPLGQAQLSWARTFTIPRGFPAASSDCLAEAFMRRSSTIPSTQPIKACCNCSKGTPANARIVVAWGARSRMKPRGSFSVCQCNLAMWAIVGPLTRATSSARPEKGEAGCPALCSKLLKRDSAAASTTSPTHPSFPLLFYP